MVSPDFKPKVNFNAMDCLTYLEHALALAYSKYDDDFYDNLQKIRYNGGNVEYAARNHFLIADWVKNNSFVFLDSLSADDIFEKNIDKKKFFKESSLVNPKIRIKFLKKESAINFTSDSLRAFGGDSDNRDTIFAAAVLSDIAGLDAAHTGFVIARKGQPLLFRHASQLKGKVIEQPLAEFLKTTKIKTPGIVFFGFSGQVRE
ncbi:xylanase [Fibrobacterales bacterium]|nr:xylanase [Fibrobacterales bacterium]